MNMFKNMNNPRAFLENMMQTNPQFKQVMDLVKQNGGDPKYTFYKLAEEQGINPDEILNMLKSQ